MPQIRKPLEQIARKDLEELCSNKTIEDEQLEFKRCIGFKGSDDPWKLQRRISDHGRNGILAEIVAFANSYGGDLLIGIEEEGGHPGRAKAIAPIDDCARAADQLAQAANACIDPPIPTLQVRAISTAGDAGLIVFRIPRSRLAPHRVDPTKECYHRVRHETKPLTMRQIQDLTFSVARGLDQIERRLEGLRLGFDAWVAHFGLSSERHLGMYVACVPSSTDCFLDQVHGVEQVRPSQRMVGLEVRKGQPSYVLATPFDVYQWAPILRGSEGFASIPYAGDARLSVHCDGSIVYDWRRSINVKEDNEAAARGQKIHILHADWFFATLVNAMESADNFRNHAGVSATEYALELHLVADHPAPVIRLGGSSVFETAGQLDRLICYPRYAVGHTSMWPELLTRLWQDFWNSIGSEASGDQLRLTPWDLDTALSEERSGG
jgi:hypothetical protein